jgi:hypothetical protein
VSPARVLALAVCVAVVPTGCRKKARSESPAASAAPKPPIDRLAPGELAPGTEVLYGMVLPRGMRVTAQFPNVAHAAGPLPAEDVANYVRDRVDSKRVELGVVGTVFRAVHVTGGDATRIYRVEVNSAGNSTEIVMRDVTPIPPKAPDPTLSDAEKWRRAGYKPNGMPLDPLKLR